MIRMFGGLRLSPKRQINGRQSVAERGRFIARVNREGSRGSRGAQDPHWVDFVGFCFSFGKYWGALGGHLGFYLRTLGGNVSKILFFLRKVFRGTKMNISKQRKIKGSNQ